MLDKGYFLKAYEIRSVIGQGGFGVVYKGVHRELGIEVAIKEYFPSELCVRRNQIVQPSKPEFQTSFEESLDRFVKEAKQLEKFRDCPNIVNCRDLFHANGTAYIIMDYVHGLPLSVLLERREKRGEPFTEQDLLQVILPLLKGLEIVHESGVCHRDIKPSNILIRRTDRAPVLIDFGAAKHEISRHTKSFAPYSDGYAALEQIGEGEIGPWTDIYGVGAVMWRMVAGGAPPFSPPNPLSSQKRAFELMNGRRDPLPPAIEIGEQRFSESILKAIDDCLVLNVNDRIQNCSKFLEKLDRESELSETFNPLPVIDEKKNDPKTSIANQSTLQNPKGRFRQKSKKPILLILGLLGFLLFLMITIGIIANSIDTDNQDAQAVVSAVAQGNAYYYGEGVAQNFSEASEWFQLAAEQGDAYAQRMIGEMYYRGEGFLQNDEESAKWFKHAADQGDAQAQAWLGHMYYNGRGVQQDEIEGIRLYQSVLEQLHTLSNQGDADAQGILGYMYLNGEGVQENIPEGFRLYHLAAEQGLAWVQRNLGLRYYTGNSAPKDNREAVKWLRPAADHGDALAQFFLGLIHDSGEGIPENDQEAVKWYHRAAEQGIAEAQFYLGLSYDSGEGVLENDQEAVKWYHRAAEQGHTEAQFFLGLSYDLGEGVTKNDREAVEWYRRAAEQGHAEAQFYLGLSYDSGKGMPENDQEAVKWYRQAAEQGYAEAQFYLGLSYDLGDGIPENDREAVEWYRRAAEQGHAEAQFYLGLSYDLGEGIPENDREAVKWYRRAAEQGHAEAQTILEGHLDLGSESNNQSISPANSRSSAQSQQSRPSTLRKNSTPQPSAITVSNNVFTRGSHSDVVLQIQGTPKSINTYDALGHEVWSYEYSTVDIDLRTKRVLSWNNTSGNLKVSLKPEIPRSGVQNFTRGSHSDVVLQIQGTPKSINTYDALGHEVWSYEYSTVDIDLRTKRVLSWNNTSGNLKVSLKPEIPRSGVQNFTRGSHSDVVLQIQGTPKSINTYDALGHEVWSYEYSTVDIDLRTKRVLSWNNTSGNLKVSLKPEIPRSGVQNFTRGSHSDVVLQIQGTPKSINTYDALGHEVWSYEYSTVDIDLRTKRVLSWNNTSGNLKIR